MPEFTMDTRDDVKLAGVPHTWGDLDAFTQGYIEALFFTECEHGVSREEHDPESGCHSNLPGDVGFSDLAAETLYSIIEDCVEFQMLNRELISAATTFPDYDEARAGNDYWYTRNGHGVGFWDRGLGEVGDKLSAACRYSEVYVYLGDDGKIYIG